MIAEAAKIAGMKVPEDPEQWEEMKDEYPHFFVYCAVQLGGSLPYWGVHFDNAKVIAEIPEEQIMKVTFADLVAKGLQVCT